MKCTDCKYCYQQDTGYSNYTVMGTDVDCLKKKHPDGCFDLFYGEEAKLNFANECADFIEGEGLFIDCDMEDGGIDAYTDDPEIKALYNQMNK